MRYKVVVRLVLFKYDLVTAWQKLCISITNAFKIDLDPINMSVPLYAPLICSVLSNTSRYGFRLSTLGFSSISPILAMSFSDCRIHFCQVKLVGQFKLLLALCQYSPFFIIFFLTWVLFGLISSVMCGHYCMFCIWFLAFMVHSQKPMAPSQ